MQTEIHSYSFPLFEHAENVFIAAYKQRQLLLGAVTAPNSSTLSLFSYEDENIKKAAGRIRKVEGRLKELAVNQYNSENLSAFVTEHQGQSTLHKLNHGSFASDQDPVSEVLLTEPDAIDSLAIKRDNSSIYLSAAKQIKIYDVEKKAVGGRIGHGLERTTWLALDPTFEMPTIVSGGKDIVFFDKKTNNEKYAIRSQGSANIVNYDYNPNKQYNLMTCHHESIKFWDLRKGTIPFKTYDDHHNLLTHAKYNHSHDELIACAYDDGSVGLLRLVSASSSIQDEAEDALVKLYDEHEDSVLRVEWTRCSPWMFASIAYNATQLVLNIVPSAEKYRILL